MEVKNAVNLAIEHIRELFKSEKLSNVGLEEVEFYEKLNEWHITIGFSRPWDYPKSTLANLAGESMRPKRSFKLVKVDDESGKVKAVKNYALDE